MAGVAHCQSLPRGQVLVQFPGQREGGPRAGRFGGGGCWARPGPSEGTEHLSGMGTTCGRKEGAGSQQRGGVKEIVYFMV